VEPRRWQIAATKRHKPSFTDITCERAIELIIGGRQPVLRLEESPGVGSTNRCQQSGTDPVTRNIRQLPLLTLPSGKS